MSARNERAGVSATVKSSFFLKMLALAVVFAILGFAAPLFGDNEFIGVLVAMSWSLAIIIGLVLLLTVVGTAVRRRLR